MSELAFRANDALWLADQVRRLEARRERERRGRIEAEQLLESKSLELYEVNLALRHLASELERRVEERTRELMEERQRAIELAERDPLTGIANRNVFDRALGESLADASSESELSLLLVDLDDFKSINDTHGHAAGDAVLVEIAKRMASTVRPGDLVARLGGDEFAIIVNVAGAGMQQMAHRLLGMLCRPVLIDGRQHSVSCSIGAAEYRDSYNGSAEYLLRDADLALYSAKRGGRQRLVVFETELRAEIEQRSLIEADVRNAVAAKHIVPWYQPITNHQGDGLIGLEVLARWCPPGGDVRLPGAFLQTVEDLGLLDMMMEQLLRTAFIEVAPMVSAGKLGYLSLNLSPAQFNRGWAVESLIALLDETAFPPQSVVVEITETALIHDINSTRVMLDLLKKKGVRIALDDFGVGYSNFALLRQLPFDILKLDRTLVADIERGKDALALAECVLLLASRLRINTVAEGVETIGQARLLGEAGCNNMQGYMLALPSRDPRGWFGSSDN